MKLIDADELLEELRKSCKYHAENSRELSLLQRDINIVKEQPTVEAIPIEWIQKKIQIIEETGDFYSSAVLVEMIEGWRKEQ